MGYALDIVSVAGVRMKLLNLFIYDLLLGSNKGVEIEVPPPIYLLLFSEKLVEQEAGFNSMFGGDLKEPGSISKDVEKNPSPL